MDFFSDEPKLRSLCFRSRAQSLSLPLRSSGTYEVFNARSFVQFSSVSTSSTSSLKRIDEELMPSWFKPLVGDDSVRSRERANLVLREATICFVIGR